MLSDITTPLKLLYNKNLHTKHKRQCLQYTIQNTIKYKLNTNMHITKIQKITNYIRTYQH